jgi:phenylacetate-CoA ligase
MTASIMSDGVAVRSRAGAIIDAVGVLVAIRRHGHAPRERLMAFQNARLRRLIAHAYETVPHYRALFERHGVRPADIQTTADLARVPVTSKRDLQRSERRDVLARGRDPSRLLAQRTSGTTGEPLVVYRTWLEERLNTAVRLRAFGDFGLRARDLRVRLNAELSRVTGGGRNWEGPQRLLRSLGFYRKMVVDYRVAPGELRDRLAALRPDVLSGAASVLAQVARVRGPGGHDALAPRVVVCAGEVLTPLDRRQISEGLGARVFNLYGSHELGLTAWQCPEGASLHVADDAVIIEIVKDGRPAGPGETGEVLATRLHTLAMPFIRYRLGDLATRGDTPCACGAPFSTLLAVEGRVGQYFSMPDGRLVHARELMGPVYRHGADWVARFQFVQETRARVVLRLVPLAPPPGECLAALAADVRATLGAGSEVAVVLVDDIPLDASGKFQVSRALGTPGPGAPGTPTPLGQPSA